MIIASHPLLGEFPFLAINKQHDKHETRMKRDNIPAITSTSAAPVRIRVVRSADQAQPANAWSKPDPVDLCLEIWKDWMAADSDRDLGTKTMRGLCGEGDGHGVDSSEAQQASDTKVAQATDAMINSMSRIHVWAIYRACSMATVWNFPNASLMDVIGEARAELSAKLRKNICTAILF